MTDVKGRVTSELKNATTWLSTNDLVGSLNLSHSSVGRALRRLWAVGTVSKKMLPGDRYGRVQWVHVDNISKNFVDALPPKGTVYVPTGRRKKLAAKLVSIPTATTTSNQGDLIMQIEQGVEVIVSDWAAAGKTFSAHEVTKELRDRVNAGTIQVDPGLAGTAHVNGKDVTKIEHDFVRDAVRDLMAAGKYPQYARVHNPGGYWEYAPMANTSGTGSASSTDPNTSSSSAPTAVSGNQYDGGSTL